MHLPACQLEGLEDGDDLLDPGKGLEGLEAGLAPLVPDGADDVPLDTVDDVGFVAQLPYLLKDFLQFLFLRP